MDCFYAAVEMRDNPKLKNIPLAIGGPSDSRSVLCTANYVARKYGVRSAMPSYIAKQKCPNLLILKPNFKKYKEASSLILEIFKSYTDIIQPLSLDEAYLDVTNCSFFNNSATLIASDIKKKIYNKTGLIASAGVAPNKFLAKVASDWNKPDGLFTISPHEVQTFIKNLKIELIPGVGQVTAKKLHQLDIFKCKDLQKKDLLFLKEHFGKFGPILKERAFGVDSSPVQVKRERKSLSLENTLSKNISIELLRDHFLGMLEELRERYLNLKIKRPDRKIKKLFIKVKTFDFKRHTAETILEPDIVYQLERGQFELEEIITYLIESFKEKVSEKEIRLVGLGFRFEENEVNTQLRLI